MHSPPAKHHASLCRAVRCIHSRNSGVRASQAPSRCAKANKKIFVVGVSLLGAAKTADAITTRRSLNQGGWENNPVFGRHPSRAWQAGVNLAFFAGESAVFYLTERNHHASIRWAGRAFLPDSIIEPSQAAACNVGLNRNTPGTCGPLVGGYW